MRNRQTTQRGAEQPNNQTTEQLNCPGLKEEHII